jgi:hypothetical protein
LGIDEVDDALGAIVVLLPEYALPLSSGEILGGAMGTKKVTLRLSRLASRMLRSLVFWVLRLAGLPEAMVSTRAEL